MLIIGDKISTNNKAIKLQIEKNDAVSIQDIAKQQYEAGANYIHLNAISFDKDEPERLKWLVSKIQDVVDVPFVLDSNNSNALEEALKVNKNGKPIINFITDEKNAKTSISEIAAHFGAGIIALCMDDSGMPETVEERLDISKRLVDKLTNQGLGLDDIYIDPMVRPVGSDSKYGVIALEAIRSIKKEFNGIHTICALNNISLGISSRNLINQSFLVAAMAAGLDGVILDPLDKKLMALVYATEVLLGKDEFCINYMMKVREGLLDV